MQQQQLASYLGNIARCWNTQDGLGIARLLSLQRNTFVCSTDDSSIERTTANKLQSTSEKVVVMVQSLIKTRKYIQMQDYERAYENQVSAFVKFLDEFRPSKTNWLVPLLHVLTFDTRMVALHADKTRKTQDKLREAEQQLKKGFSLAANDRSCSDGGKKLGALYVVNQLFKIYFKLNTIVLCRNIVRAVEGPVFPALERFPKQDTVTYMFYTGRIAMFEDNYQKSATCFDFALKHCHKNAAKNMKLILQFLIPIKMYLGTMPSIELLQHYEFAEYIQLRQAVLTGNIKLFEDTYHSCYDQFVKLGMYLLIEKLKYVMYRNLIKKIRTANETHLIRLDQFQLGIKLMSNGLEPPLDDVECLLANMIHMGYIKGYISHEKSTVVLSKKLPFPPISECNNPN